MQKRIIYFIICVIYSCQLSAQSQEDLSRTLDSLDKGIKTISKNKQVSDSCKKKLKQFEKSFIKPIAGEWNELTVKSIVKNSEKFITFYNSKANKGCLDKNTKELVKKAGLLIAESKKFLPSSKTSKDSASGFVDSIKSKPTPDTSTINSAGVVIKSPQPMDSMGINSSELVTSSPSATDNKASWFIVSTVIFALIIIVLVIIILRFSKTLKSLVKKMEVHEPLKNEASANEEITEPLTAFEVRSASSEATGEEVILAVIPEATPAIAPQTSPPYFICEVMMTAGPRKKFMGEENADKDLGEDVCGFVSIPDQVLVWLLDGTSDLHCLRNPLNRHEYFSSRLLALGISEKLKIAFLATMGGTDISDMINNAIAAVKHEWLAVIEQLPNDEKQVLKLNIENKNYPECAATILIAGLKINGDLTAYRSGDSKMFFFKDLDDKSTELDEASLSDKNDQSNDRIFFRLKLDEQGKFDIICNEPLHEIVTGTEISSIICFSDGIGKDTELLLIEEYKKDPERTRREIVYHLQETGDDKSICFIGIKPALAILQPDTISNETAS